MKNSVTHIATFLLLSAFLGLPFVSLAQAGMLDTSFDTDGIVTTSVGISHDYGNSVAIQSDGKIVVAGYSNPGNMEFAVVRYNINGSLDNTFDSDGKVTTDVGPTIEVAKCVIIQNDGKILVAGYSTTDFSSDLDFALVRYNTNGGLDTTFDTDGIVTTSLTTYHDYGNAIAIQSDGKILVAATSPLIGFILARYYANGSLDTTFDTDGIVTTTLGTSYNYDNSLAIQTDGKILVAGINHNGSNEDFALVRYNTNGSIDSTFDLDGKVTTPIGNSIDEGSSVAIQIDGKILVAGSSFNNSSNFDFALVRYNTNGSLDTTFDTDGKVITPIGSSDDVGQSMAIQSDGKILVAGFSDIGTYNEDFALIRYNTNGSIDSTFESDGKVTTPIGTADDFGKTIAIQSDGKILVVGSSLNNSTIEFALVRYNNKIGAPFPLELLSFDAICNNRRVDLDWTVATQINNDYFNIERSTDGFHFEIIGTVNSNETNHYNFVDTDPLLGNCFYRLKQTDLDGQFQYFKIASATCTDFTELSIYPNPNNGKFIIESAELDSDLIITDVLDRIIFQTNIIGAKTEIDLGELTKGLYLVVLIKDGQKSIKKIIIN